MIIIVSISIAAVRVKLMLTQEQAIDTVQRGMPFSWESSCHLLET